MGRGGGKGIAVWAGGANGESLPLVQAAQNVVPVAVTAGDKIEGLRQWVPVGACRRIGRGCIRGWKEGAESRAG